MEIDTSTNLAGEWRAALAVRQSGKRLVESKIMAVFNINALVTDVSEFVDDGRVRARGFCLIPNQTPCGVIIFYFQIIFKMHPFLTRGTIFVRSSVTLHHLRPAFPSPNLYSRPPIGSSRSTQPGIVHRSPLLRPSQDPGGGERTSGRAGGPAKWWTDDAEYEMTIERNADERNMINCFELFILSTARSDKLPTFNEINRSL